MRYGKNVVRLVGFFAFFSCLWAKDTLSVGRLELEHLLLTYSESPIGSGERLLLADSIARFCAKAGDMENAVRFTCEKALLQENAGSFRKAFYTWKFLMSDLVYGYGSTVQDGDAACMEKDSILKIAAIRMVSDAMQAGMKREGIEAAYRFLQSYPEAQDYEKAFVYSNLGSLYMYSGRVEEAYGFHRKAIGMMERCAGNAEEEAWVYRNFSNWFFAEGEMDSALFYLLKINPAEYPEMDMDFYYNNLACIYAEMNRTDLAFQYFEKALACVNEKGGKSFRKTRILQNCGSIYRTMGKMDEAESYYEEALRLCRELGYYDVEYEVLKEYAFLLRDQGRLESAWDALVSAYALRDSIWRAEDAEAVFDLRKDFELQKIQSELHEAEMANVEKKLTLSILSFLLLFMVLFLAVLLYRLKKERVERRALNQELTDKGEALMKDIESKNRRIVTSTVLNTKKDELLTQIQLEAESLKESLKGVDSAKIQQVDRMLHLLQKERLENRWKVFIRNFEETYPHFFDNLERETPALTKGEKRLAALLAAGLNAKEIAEMINRTPTSVETFIYRLRKKIGIDRSVKTSDYFEALREESVSGRK